MYKNGSTKQALDVYSGRINSQIKRKAEIGLFATPMTYIYAMYMYCIYLYLSMRTYVCWLCDHRPTKQTVISF